LVECVREERISCVISSEALFEEEKIIYIIENSMEIRAQQIWLNKASVFAEVWVLIFANHGLKIVLLKLFNFLLGY